jgi:hypothetical protein
MNKEGRDPGVGYLVVVWLQLIHQLHDHARVEDGASNDECSPRGSIASSSEERYTFDEERLVWARACVGWRGCYVASPATPMMNNETRTFFTDQVSGL